MQEDIKSADSEAVEIVALNKSLDCGLDLPLPKETNLREQTRMRVPDWVQLYVNASWKQSYRMMDGKQCSFSFLQLGRSGVIF